MTTSNEGTSRRPSSSLSAPFAPKADLVVTRTFDAPRELVFRVWTDPEHIAQWWGPHGFKTTVHEMEVRPGGRWRYSMRGPDGNDYPFEGTYVDVVKPERLVFDGTIHGSPEQRVWTEVVFVERKGETEVTVRQMYSFKSDATRGASTGWNQQLDRLTHYLAAL